MTRVDRTAAFGRVELLADADRPGGWLLTVDRIRQSYVDLDDPTYLDFEYVQAFADVLDALPPGPLAVTHVGGGGCTLARYVAAHPARLTAARAGAGRGADRGRAGAAAVRPHGTRIRPVDGRAGVAQLRDASADVVVVDAFRGGRVTARARDARVRRRRRPRAAARRACCCSTWPTAPR